MYLDTYFEMAILKGEKVDNTASRTMESSGINDGFIRLQSSSATPEQVVLLLENYAEQGKTVDRKAIRAMEGKEFTGKQFERMILAACKGHRAQMGRGRLGDALEYSNIFIYLYPRSIK